MNDSGARLPGPHADRFARLSFQPCVQAPARARHAVALFLGDESGEELTFALELIASELVKNAVLYGSSDEPVLLELTLRRDCVDLRVANRGERIHMKELRTRRAEGGRGLELVDALTSEWSIESGPLETSVSARIPRVGSLFEQRQPARLTRSESGYDHAVSRRKHCGPDRNLRQSASGRARS
jgi:anti-sigma regulatory factor (Ser/Thr protein kinase)